MLEEKEIINIADQWKKEELFFKKEKFYSIVKIIKILIGMLIGFIIFGFMVLYYNSCMEENKKYYDKKQLAFEECVMKLGIDVCSYVGFVWWDSNKDSVDKIRESYGKCIENIGIMKCNMIKEINGKIK